MTISSSTQPSLRARILPRFPANVLAGNGIVITKSGQTYVFETAPYANIPLSALASIPANTLVGRDAVSAGPPAALSVAGGLGMSGAGSLELVPNQRIRYITVPLFQNGSVLTTGVKADFLVPFSCTIRRVTLLADQNGNIVIDIWKNTFANFPPTGTNSITAAAKPTLAAANKFQDSVLSGWTTTISAGDILRFNIDSVLTVTRVTVCLDVETV